MGRVGVQMGNWIVCASDLLLVRPAVHGHAACHGHKVRWYCMQGTLSRLCRPESDKGRWAADLCSAVWARMVVPSCLCCCEADPGSAVCRRSVSCATSARAQTWLTAAGVLTQAPVNPPSGLHQPQIELNQLLAKPRQGRHMAVHPAMQ